MSRTKKMITVTRTGTRLEQLKNLAIVLAREIDTCEDVKTIPQLSRQYRETIREIEEIEGTNRNDDEIGKLLSARKADGKSDAVR